MSDSLFSLRLDAIISSYNYNNNISYASTSSSHCCKCFMPWSIDKCDIFTIFFNHISTNMLSNTASLTTCYSRVLNIIKQTCLTMIDMPHNSYYWSSRFSMQIIFIFVCFNIVKFLLSIYDINLNIKLSTQNLNLIFFQKVIFGSHFTKHK